MIIVFITEKGDCWHTRRDCHGLVGGQMSSESVGREPCALDEVELNAAVAAGKKACGVTTCAGATS
ncbi:hypothetical protein AB0L53_48715 [Nonomuraea sp. NPDC052129]|uniref:hypothetical protein n=1 Tax=Nonomuraea sp. NPDC052129 TaxID=3154651 RepID=UPI00344A4E9C